MERHDMIYQLTALGMRVKCGSVYDAAGMWLGNLWKDDFQMSSYLPDDTTFTPFDEYVPLKDIASLDVTWSGGDADRLTVVMEDGARRPVVPQRVSDSDLALLMAQGPGKTASVAEGKDGDRFVVVDDAEWVGKKNLEFHDLNDVFPQIYPDAGEKLYYDVLTNREKVDMSLFDRPEKGIVTLDDSVVRVYHDNIERRIRGCAYEGRMPTKDVRLDTLLYHAEQNVRNRFIEWVESHEWDGRRRMATWFRDLFGATAPALTAEEEAQYLGAVAEAWFVGGIKRMYSKTKHEIVPVFLGGQGAGKGNALCFTAGMDDWYRATAKPLKDEREFLESVNGAVIVELGEGVALRTSDADTVKAFISQPYDQYRKPYARFEQEFPRRWICAITTNMVDIFNDITGNRRFFPMYCDPDRATMRFSINRKVGQYEVEQVWAEALHSYRNGGKWFINPRIDRLAGLMQDFYTVENASVSAVDEWLDNDEQYRVKGAVISKTDIINHFKRTEGDVPDENAEKIYRTWANSTKTGWEPTTDRSGKPSCVSYFDPVIGKRKAKRGYIRRYEPGEEIVRARLKMVDDDELPDDTVDLEHADPLTVMREVCTANRCVDKGDVFPAHLVSEKILTELTSGGMLFKENVDGKPVYKVAYLL